MQTEANTMSESVIYRPNDQTVLPTSRAGQVSAQQSLTFQLTLTTEEDDDGELKGQGGHRDRGRNRHR